MDRRQQGSLLKGQVTLEEGTELADFFSETVVSTFMPGKNVRGDSVDLEQALPQFYVLCKDQRSNFAGFHRDTSLAPNGGRYQGELFMRRAMDRPARRRRWQCRVCVKAVCGGAV